MILLAHQQKRLRIRAIARSLTWALLASPILSLSTPPPALANCPDSVGNLDYYEPAVDRLWEQLQAQTDYPWGSETNRQVPPTAIHNAGNPQWRTVRFFISPEVPLSRWVQCKYSFNALAEASCQFC